MRTNNTDARRNNKKHNEKGEICICDAFDTYGERDKENREIQKQ